MAIAAAVAMAIAAAVAMAMAREADRTCSTHSSSMSAMPRSAATIWQPTDRVSECPTSAQAETHGPAACQ
jgi:hypothetical protein